MPLGVLKLLWAAVLAAALSGARADDFQTWHTALVPWFANDRVELLALGHVRFTDDSSDLTLWRVGQVATITPQDWLRVGVGYRFAQIEAADGQWRYQHRAEVQVIPVWRWGPLGMTLRNRVEWRWNEDQSGVNERVRVRLRGNLPTPGWGPARGIYFSNELIYGVDRSELTENRLIPIGLRLPLGERNELRLYYMLRSLNLNASTGWENIHVIGTAFILRP